jgi:hypothetical protein
MSSGRRIRVAEGSTYREIRAQLRLGLSLPRTIRLFTPHVKLGDLERFFVCHGPCGMRVAVGPCFEGIDPAGFVCGGCLTAAGEVETGELEALSAATGRDGQLINGLAGQPERGRA